jgi:CcmD family protein
VKESKVSVMRALSSLLVLGVSLGLAVGVAQAQPPPPPPPAPAPADAPAMAGAPAAAGDPAELRKLCVAAMNANETFARSIIQKAIDTDRVSVQAMCADVDTVKTHQEAVAYVEKNERHVIAAYAAMWVIAALFLLYLLRRQQRLKAEIDQLRRDLDAAAKDGK